MTSPTYDICVGHAFKVDTNGVLQLRVAGDPAEGVWPYAGSPASDNPLRVDPAAGLWVPPQTQAGIINSTATGSPTANLTTSKNYTTPALQVIVKNPSDSLPATVLAVGEARWIATVRASSQCNGGIQMTQDAPLGSTGYTQAQDSGPYDDSDHSWSGQAYAWRPFTLEPGGSATLRMAGQVWMRNGTATLTYYHNTIAGLLVAGALSEVSS